MRFNDMLNTVMARPVDDSGAANAVWLQIVDILAQDRDTIPSTSRQELIARLNETCPKIPLARRRMTAQSLVGRTIARDLVQFFANDVPSVAAPVLLSAELVDADWAQIIPGFPSPSRALLRERKDISLFVKRILASYGASDFSLGTTAVSDTASAATNAPMPLTSLPLPSSQIRELVARIEAYRHGHDRERKSEDLGPQIQKDVTSFRFETGTDGIISWVEGAPRGPIIGIETGTMAQSGGHGVDGQASGAFKRRTAYRSANMIVPGAGPASGAWLISAIPCFHESDGRFFGYRGSARRPERHETNLHANINLLGEHLPPDSVRQLVHELRTPLNAMRGFAEMINDQILGPVSKTYRQRAHNIMTDSNRLLQLFDDLDLAAKLENGLVAEDISNANPNTIVQNIVANFRSMTDGKNVHLRVTRLADDFDVRVDKRLTELVLERLLSTVIGLAASDETLGTHLSRAGDHIHITVDRPKSLADVPEQVLFDTNAEIEGDWPDAPLMGLGFALRLIENTAKVANASLSVTESQFILMLPITGGQIDSSNTA